MRDEPTLTEIEPIDAIAAQLQSFRDDPTEQDLFRELKRALRSASRTDDLAELFELRAAVEPNQQEAARQWFDAANLRLANSEEASAIADFRNVLSIDPAHEKAARICCERLITAQRYAEAANLVEAEIAALNPTVGDEPSAATRRLAARNRVLAELWQEQLGRLDKALQCWQRSFQLEPSQTTALEQSRVIYASLGDEDMVLALYETELQLIGQSGNRARRAEIELALGGLKRRRSDTQGAAEHLESALQLNPDSLDARESLAEVLSSLEDQSQHQRASELFVELGQRRMQTEDQEGAISYLRRALGVDPTSEQGTNKLESVLHAARRWTELDRLYQQRLGLATTPAQRAPILVKRAELCEQHLDDKDGLKDCLRQLSALHAPGNDFQKRLRVLLEADDEGEEIVQLLEAEIATKAAGDPQLVALLLDLANIYRVQMSDRDRAAETLHRILGYDPLNSEALARYSEHFRERRDWRGLTDLSEYTIDQMRERQASVPELVERLESVAELCELRLGDIDRAILTWRRIEELEGHTPKTSDALQRLMSRAKMWESLVGVLEQEAQQATTPDARAKTLRRIAQVYRERQVNPRRAISLYEEVLGMFPNDDSALKALAELYDKEGDEAGLAHTIRRQLDLAAQRLDATSTEGRPGTERKWPVAKRTERLTSLRRVAAIYETQLADVEGVVYACSGILELLPGDREALDRMERVLEKAGDNERLEQTLEYHAACSTAPVERSKLLRRMARLAESRSDEVAAMDRWEQVLKAAPNDIEALEQLAGLYERHQRHTDLAEVLDRALMNAEIPPTGSAAAAHMSAQLKRLARVLDEELSDATRATRVWQRLLTISERDRDSLNALCRLHEDARRWRELAEVLERQVPVYATDDPEKAAVFALKRADLLEERLGSPELATEALEHLIAHVAPRNLEAHRKLRRLYETRGSFEASIRIAEREMVLTKDANAKISRGLEIGLLCRDRISDPKRALQAYERVLKLAPEHEEALAAAAELYAKVGRWREHAALLERRAHTCSDPSEKRALMLRIANVTAEELADHRSAFGWYSRAHELSPDATTMGELRRAAESYGLWRELANVYEGDREQLREAGGISDKRGFVQLSKDIAQIAEARLRDPKRAIDSLFAGLQVAPQDQHLMIEAERIAQEANRKPIWDRLLECFDLPMAVAVGEERIQLYRRRAALREEHAHDVQGALEDLLVAFAWSAHRSELRVALYEFGERNRDHWQQILTAETALAERAPDTSSCIAILRRKAEAYEKRANDPIRAFRTHMSAFILVPEDEETLTHLWRLARHIGRYTDAQRTPEEELPAAHIHASQTRVSSMRKRPLSAAKKPRREATQELSISDLVDDEDLTTMTDVTLDEGMDLAEALIANQSPVGESTQELDISELMDSDNTVPDPTMELRTEDLIEALGRKTTSAPPSPPKAQGQRKPGQGPPPPPPKRPEIRPMPGVAPVAVTTSKSGRVSVPTASAAESRHALPSSPRRAYSSPWSELASVYCKLPADTQASRLRWHYRAAEVWETGAKEVNRAFDVLATALRADPNNTETRDRLFQIASTHNEWDRLAQLYDRAAETAGSAEAAAELLMQVAIIRAKQSRPRETESLYRRVLGMRPGDVRAREALEQLYRSEERWIDLAAQLEERTDPRLGSAAPISQRPILLRELALLYSDKLSRPHDAIDTLERLLAIEPENTELLGEVAKAYESIGKWSKVIQTLTRLCDLADGSEGAREALRHIGRIYEEQLELPDRAIVAYSRLLGEWHRDEDAFHALDRLYQQYARWEDLDAILRQRAAIVREPEARAALLHRRAKIMLEWLNAPDDAAAALRHARTIDPENRELADDLMDALTKAGRHREASSVLEGRIARLRDGGDENRAAGGEIAALLIRLGALRGDSLSDPIGAKQVLQEALDLVPSHPTALATLARLTSAEMDPCAHAEAKLLEAAALEDVDAKVDALLDAGQSFRDGRDHAAARSAFEEILALRPYHAESTWALAALVEEGGDVEGAIRLLSARLQATSLESKERAEVLTQLAALSRQAGVESAAEERLKEALEHEPEHLGAILSLADLLSQAERWQDLELFLSEILPRVEANDADTRAELMRRLASAYDGLDRPDDAYQTLIGADRLHRGSLLVKLALGENRYRARRWREAALHLSALAEREDARSHPSLVANGLYHAALAEIRSLRPEKAEALYRAALALKGNYGPALRALAEIEMERGNTAEASDLLTKQAVATESPKERLRLFEALGDMAMQELHDESRAKVCYEAALRAAEPLDSEHIPLLQKLLSRQVAAGERAECGRTCELLASFMQNDEERCERHTEAAQHFIDAQLPAEARNAAQRAVSADPYDIVACDMASELAMEAGDHEATAGMLGRLLNHRENASSESDAKDLARLWNRLADARRARGDNKSAESCYEKALALSPNSEGALSARRALLVEWANRDDKTNLQREFRKTLASSSLAVDDIVEYAHGEATADADGARCALELAAALGYEYNDSDVAFLARHTTKVMADDEAYKGSLAPKARATLLADAADEPLATICQTLWESAALLWSNVDAALERSGVAQASRITATGKLRAAAIYTRIARAMSAPATILYTSDAEDAPDVQVICVSPPVIVFGPRLSENGGDHEPVSDLELRFLLARAAELVRPSRIVAAGQPAKVWEQLIASLWRIFGDADTASEVSESQHLQDEELRTTLPVRARAKLEDLLSERPQLAGSAAPTRFLAACQRAADRSGLLLCGDMDSALRYAAWQDDQTHLLRMPLQPAYLATRAQLGIDVKKR
tara:strand:- start:5956 stop:14361 length:8406 start_codon:yes stop_codon:yes gene_type:complete